MAARGARSRLTRSDDHKQRSAVVRLIQRDVVASVQGRTLLHSLSLSRLLASTREAPLLAKLARTVRAQLVRQAEALGVERVAARVLEQVLEPRRVDVDVALDERRELRRVRVGAENGAKVGVDHALHRVLELLVDLDEVAHELVVLDHAARAAQSPV